MTPDEWDALAAEYVIGTLSPEERADAERRLAENPAFAALVRTWEDRLAPLDAATSPVQPPGRLWPRVEAAVLALEATPAVDPLEKLADAAGADTPASVIDLTRRLRTWRRLAGAAGALAAALAAVVVLDRLEPSAADTRFVAVVNRDASLPALLVDVDVGTGTVTVRPVGAQSAEGRSLELWLVPEGGAPRSLGLIDPQARVIRIDDAGALTGAGAIAVSEEPPGGSPTGSPTGPVVYSGALIPAP